MYNLRDGNYPINDLRDSDWLLMRSGALHFQQRSTRICIVGVGFVGESLLSNFAREYDVIGFDISEKRIAHLQNRYQGTPKATFTSDQSLLSLATHYLISVPTLLREDNTVDLSHLKAAVNLVLSHARPGCTIVIESSVTVGMTRSLLGPVQNLFHCGMSPERVDPGRISPAAHEIPKIISGLTRPALKQIQNLYSRVFEHLVTVSKPEVAEMSKLYENCYRMVNIAYVNEISDACQSHNIDPEEMINASATKPYGFQAFRPGLGVGGHCIPVNPYYLLANNELPLLQQATIRTNDRPRMIARRLYKEWSERDLGICLHPRVLVVGLGFKPGQSVLSYSPALSLAREMRDIGVSTLFSYDPIVSQETQGLQSLHTSDWTAEYLEQHFDMIVVCMRQHQVDFTILDQLSAGRVQWMC